jgi:predicted nicotinamide N-methyase
MRVNIDPNTNHDRMLPTMSMDFSALKILKDRMPHNREIEYIWHKLFDNPNADWKSARIQPPTWSFPECWCARYWLYFEKHRQFIQQYHVLDLGSNLNFYAVWALINGAKQITSVEPDPTRKKLGDEYSAICGYDHLINSYQLSIEDFLSSKPDTKFDVIFLLDVLYYLDNPIQILKSLKNHFEPRYLFLESTIIDDYCSDGHFEVWYPSTDPKLIQSFQQTPNQKKSALKPSRNALQNLLLGLGWKILSYYDYMDFRGRGESLPRRDGHKDFYLLGSIDRSN